MTMSEITPLSEVQQLCNLSRQLDALGQRNADDERRYVKAEHEYTIAKAIAYLKAEGSIATREAIATVETADQRLRAKQAEADVRIDRANINILRTRMEAGRSTVAVLRTEAQL